MGIAILQRAVAGILCAVLALTGMGLFSLFTAEFATFILKEVKNIIKRWK